MSNTREPPFDPSQREVQMAPGKRDAQAAADRLFNTRPLPPLDPSHFRTGEEFADAEAARRVTADRREEIMDSLVAAARAGLDSADDDRPRASRDMFGDGFDTVRVLATVPRRLSWHDYFLNGAKWAASGSKDPTTQVGCLLIGPDKQTLGTGYNGLPRGVRDLPERMERPAKYLWTSHAEENAIATAARDGHRTKGATAYVTHAPCSRCARSLIQAGIVCVVTGGGKTSMPREEFEIAADMFAEAGVEVQEWTTLADAQAAREARAVASEEQVDQPQYGSTWDEYAHLKTPHKGET